MTLDEIINQVETIIRLRSAVRVARETIASATKELTVVTEELKNHETALAAAISADTRPGKWHEMELTSGGWEAKSPPLYEDILAMSAPERVDGAALAKKAGWTRPRLSYGDIKKGDVVWMTRRKALGVVIKVNRDGYHTISADGKTYHYTAKNLCQPLPGEIKDWKTDADAG